MYAVYARHVDRDNLLGFACGEVKDIEAYYDDSNAYGLRIEPVFPKHIPAGYAEKKAELLAKKSELKRKLKELENKLTL